jgi:hypothetical protein
MVAICLWGHLRNHWSRLSWVRLAVEGVDYNLHPVAAYALTHAVGGWLQGQALKLVPLLLKQRSIRKLRQQHLRLVAVWAGAAVQLAVGASLVLLLVERPQPIQESGGKAPPTPYSTKEAVLQTIEKILHAVSREAGVQQLTRPTQHPGVHAAWLGACLSACICAR